jgi:hypothetical protein
MHQQLLGRPTPDEGESCCVLVLQFAASTSHHPASLSRSVIQTVLSATVATRNSEGDTLTDGGLSPKRAKRDQTRPYRVGGHHAMGG